MAAPDFETMVRVLVEGGESYYVEFKTCWSYGPDGKAPRDIKEVARDIGEAIVAFANSDGGDLLIGVEDSGNVTGVPWDGDRLNYLIQAARTQVKDVDLGVSVHDVTVDGHTVLLYRVPEHPGEAVVTVAGACLWRRGAASEPVAPMEIERRRHHRLGDSKFEAEPVPNATLDDLDLSRVLAHGPEHAGVHLQRLQRDHVGLLRYWNLVESRNGSVVLRRAALLLFAKEPLRWHPNNRLRIRRILGQGAEFGDRLRTRDREIDGPIDRILQQAGQTLESQLEVEARRQSQLFSVTHILPTDAVEECIVNAVAHRNYAIEGSAIEVHIYPDRVEFLSPGRLPEPLTLEDLRAREGAHRSRNPIIMRVLRDLGWTRDQGEGMRRIFGAMSQLELHEPELDVRADTFIVRLSTQSLYDEPTQALIAAYAPFGLQPAERRYVVALQQEGGELSTDRLARRLGQSFDDTKLRLDDLERKRIVWHAYKSRTYHLVQPLAVPHERALRRLEESGVAIDARATIDRAALAQILDASDDATLDSQITRWKESGILTPSGKGRFRLGQSLLEYKRKRDT